MDLTNKIIRIKKVVAISNPLQYVVDIDVVQEISPLITQVIGSYEFNLNDTFSGPDDPRLMESLTELLSSI